MTLTKISIITPCLNRANYIEKAIQSVLCQNYPDVEHIIVDGGSTDNTLEILRKYPHLYVTSEPDKGMYDAINKGLNLTHGDVIGFLNSDDLYVDGAFNTMGKKFEDESALAVIGEATVILPGINEKQETINSFSPAHINLLEISTIGDPFFNAWFFRRSVFETIGTFNASYRIAADRDFILRFALSGLEFQTLDTLVYQYRQHEGSMTFDVTDEKFERILREHIQMTNSYLRRSDVPMTAKQFLCSALTRDTQEMSVRALKCFNISKFFLFMLTGWRYDFGLPYKILKRVLGKYFPVQQRKVSQ